MYQVTNAYKNAMKDRTQRFRMTGTLAGRPFTDANILKGSFCITNQCCDETEMKIGQVYIGELSGTFLRINLERYKVMGKTIEPVFGRMLASKEYEDVPLGIYTISEANVTVAGLDIKAYDNMAKTDKTCSIDSSLGSPYELASMACEACDVELGTTEAEFSRFANGDETLSMYSPNDIETWRDFLSWLAQACACNVTCDRRGRIVFRPYNQTVVDEIDARHRFKDASFSDYETRYTGISVVNMKDGVTKYYGMKTDDALTYNLGSNPFLQFGLQQKAERLRRAVLNALQSIKYVPFKVQMIGDPVYDLGDVFRFTEGIADEAKICCLTKYFFKFNGVYEIEGVGKNPALASAKSKTDKNISGLMGQIEGKNVPVISYTNAGDITVTETKETPIITIGAAASAEAQPVFLATVPLNMSLDGVVRFRFYHDAVLQEEETVSMYLPRGAGMVPLEKVLAMPEDTRLTLMVTAQAEYFESDKRIQDAQIGGLIDFATRSTAYRERDIDRTPPQAAITDKSIKAILIGQGLAVGAWDGTITLSDYMDVIRMEGGELELGAMTDQVTVNRQIPKGDTFAENMGVIQMTGGLLVIGMTDLAEVETR